MEQLSPELNSLHNRLVASQKEGARVRRSIQQPALRATGVMALGGIAVLVGFLVADLACYAVFGVLLLFPAAFAAILALLPTDQELIRIGTLNGAATNVLLTLAFALLAWQNALVEARADGMCYRRNGSSQPCAVNNAEVAYTAAFAVVSFVQAVRQLRAYAIGLPARAMLDLLWRVGGAHSMLFGVCALGYILVAAALDSFTFSRHGPLLIVSAQMMLLGMAAMRPTFRMRTQALPSSRRGAVRSAPPRASRRSSVGARPTRSRARPRRCYARSKPTSCSAKACASPRPTRSCTSCRRPRSRTRSTRSSRTRGLTTRSSSGLRCRPGARRSRQITAAVSSRARARAHMRGVRSASRSRRAPALIRARHARPAGPQSRRMLG